jgi:hypothetical protein
VMEDLTLMRCWQAISRTRIQLGTIHEQKMENGWLMYLVEWDNGYRDWEKAVNISFTPLPTLGVL